MHNITMTLKSELFKKVCAEKRLPPPPSMMFPFPFSFQFFLPPSVVNQSH